MIDLSTETRSPATALAARLPWVTILQPDAPGQDRVEVPVARLPEACQEAVTGLGATLATMVGLDDRDRSGNFRLVYAFAVGPRWLSIEAPVDPGAPAFPSVTPLVPAAHWY